VTVAVVEDPRTRVVAAGYDAIADRFAEWGAGTGADPRQAMLELFATRLEPGAAVVDLGCGDGRASTALLAERFEVTGVDVSGRQIEIARRAVPAATFIEADFTRIDVPAASLSGVTAFYALSHVPREEHAALFARIHGWLRPGGLFLATLGARDNPDWIGDWLGTRMFFSSFDADTNRRLLREAGFELLVDDVLETEEPEGTVPFLWVLAQSTGGEGAAA
jgi:SAM-dependent methyltransferase